MTRDVVLIGEAADPDLAELHSLLTQAGVRVIFWRLGLDATLYQLEWTPPALPILTSEGQRLDALRLRQAGVVLFKRYRMDSAPLISYTPGSAAEGTFGCREWESAVAAALRILLREVTNSCIGSLDEAVWHDRKVEMLVIAEQLGLAVPPTLITTSPSAGFLEQPLITKAINADERIDESRRTRTTLLSADVRESLRGALLPVPALLQRYIARESEMRIIALGDTSVELSLTSPPDVIDARVTRPELRRVLIRPARADEPLRRLMTHCGLTYCTFDIIVDMNGIEWLVDCTPRGSWSWYGPEVGRHVVQAVRSLCA